MAEIDRKQVQHRVNQLALDLQRVLPPHEVAAVLLGAAGGVLETHCGENVVRYLREMADEIEGKRRRGRPQNDCSDRVKTWAMVELMRDRQGSLKRHSVFQGAVLLAKRLGRKGPSADTSRRLHRENEQWLAAEYPREELPRVREDLLREVRHRRDDLGWETDPQTLIGNYCPEI